MIETVEFRINYDYSHLLFAPEEGKDLGTTAKVVRIRTDDPRYLAIPQYQQDVRREHGSPFFFSWKFIREYTKKELADADLFTVVIRPVFEPTGEDCSTQYDEASACQICGANRKLVGPLKLSKSSVPKRDIARTIAGEVVVSARFAAACQKADITGMEFRPVVNKEGGEIGLYQPVATRELELSHMTSAGNNPFTASSGCPSFRYFISGHEIVTEDEVYVCPTGHLLGLNRLSEVFVLKGPAIGTVDFFVSNQKFGVRRGYLQPEPVYLCSRKFRELVIAEKLSGFAFEVANVVESDAAEDN